MGIRDIIKFITSKTTLKVINIIIIVIGIGWLILGISLYTSEHFEQKKASTALEYSTEAYTAISNTYRKPPTTKVPSHDASALLSEQTTAPPSVDYLSTFAIKRAKENKDVIGWIRIKGMSVNFPVVQAEDNIYYLNHDAGKNKNEYGAIFLDYRCDPISLSGINILYGHHMKNGSMFAYLVKYKDEEILKNHPIIEFATLEKTYQWEIFSVIITDPSYDYLKTEFSDSEHYLAFITGLQTNSIFETGILLSESDDVLILSTCTYEYENARFVIVAKKIQ